MDTPSVLLPVYNAQSNLERDVMEILDILAELTDRFELAILDDGSTDETAEVARELAARFPQIRVIRHPVRLGLAEAIQTGLDHVPGEIILLGDEEFRFDPDDLHTLWQLRDAQGRMRRQDELPTIARQAWIEKLLAWRPLAAAPRAGFQIIFRQAFEQFRGQQADEMMCRVDAPSLDASTVMAHRLKEPKYLRMAGQFAVE